MPPRHPIPGERSSQNKWHGPVVMTAPEETDCRGRTSTGRHHPRTQPVPDASQCGDLTRGGAWRPLPWKRARGHTASPQAACLWISHSSGSQVLSPAHTRPCKPQHSGCPGSNPKSGVSAGDRHHTRSHTCHPSRAACWPRTASPWHHQ